MTMTAMLPTATLTVTPQFMTDPLSVACCSWACRMRLLLSFCQARFGFALPFLNVCRANGASSLFHLFDFLTQMLHLGTEKGNLLAKIRQIDSCGSNFRKVSRCQC